MLTKKILQNHPTFSAHDRLVNLCNPLANVGITYFAYVQAKSTSFVGLNTSPAMSESYIKEKCYNIDIHIEGNMHLNEGDKFYTVWDTLHNKAISDICRINSQYNISHLFTITEKQQQHVDCYHFAATENNTAINQFYYNNIDFLHKFIASFKERLSIEKNLKQLFDFPFALKNHSESNNFLLQHTARNNVATQHILHLIQHNKLSIAQLELLLWLFNNKTRSDILHYMKLKKSEFTHLAKSLLILTKCKNILELRQCLGNIRFEDLCASFLHVYPEKSSKKDKRVLTHRESECLLWSAKGKTAWEISKILDISKNTVNEYLHSASRKLNTSSKTGSVAKAILCQEFDMDQLMAWLR